MLGKRSRPSIRKFTGVLRTGIMDSNTSPRSPLECKMQSPRGLKNYDQVGIGLGIVVALDKPTNDVGPGEILAKYAIRDQYSTPSRPILVNPTTRIEMDTVGGLDEEFTYVTCHGPNKSVTTRVYYDGGEFGKISQNINVLKTSSTRLTSISDPESNPQPRFDFLSSCHLCRKTLHGKDIYMYRGEKAFCSEECRQRQIGIEERKEQCRSEASRTRDVSSSPCTYNAREEIFFSACIVAV